MFTDYELSLMTLQDQGLTREQAIETAGFAAVSPDKIAAKRAEIDAHIAAKRERVYAESPEGRTKAALEAQARKRERASLADAARTLLADEHGIDASQMSDRQALTAAGIEKKERSEMSFQEWDRECETLAASWRYLPEAERRSECRRLEQSYAQVDGYVATFLSGPSNAAVSDRGDAA